MQGLDPQKVDTKDVFAWFNQSIQLINRRVFHYLFSVIIFFACLAAISQAIQLLQSTVPAIALLLAFLFVGVFLFYFFIATLVMISYCADHSEDITVSLVMQQFVISQRAFIIMTMLASAIGVFYWYLGVLMNPSSDIIVMSENTINLLSNEGSILFYTLKTGAIFLYFLLIVTFFLRTFFSAPLVLFHGLSYQEAKALSHRGIFKNIRPMSYVMITWFALFSVATLFAPVLSLALMPLFCAFAYVAYRHVYLGQGTNKVAVKRTEIITA